jgi:hypothetical protein
MVETLDPVASIITYHRAISERFNMRYNPRSKPFPDAYAALNSRKYDLKIKL